VTQIAGTNLSFGPYAETQRFRISCYTGALTLVIAVYDPSLLATDADISALSDAIDLKADIASMAPVILAITDKTPVNAVGSAAKLTSSGAMAPATHATTILTNDTTDIDDTKIITIGSTVYRFMTTIAQAYDVTRGSSAAESLDNLKAAINAGAGEGTAYFAGTLAHPDFVATDNAATTQVIQARAPGDGKNGEDTLSDDVGWTWEGATVASGTGGVSTATATITIGTRVYTIVDELSETEAEAIVDQILYGGSEAIALDNMALAIDHGATEGTEYSTGTVVNADVVAGANTNTTQIIVAKVKGVIGDLIAIDETLANTVWDDPAGTLGTEVAGVDGTVGVEFELCADSSYLYYATAENTIADANWRRVDIGSVY
jgi:hypothetical protein